MINDRYRQNNNEEDNVTLRTALKGTAIAGAVGLAMAYQPWGRRATRFLGRVIDTTRRTVQSMERIRQGESLRHYTKSDYSKLYDNLRSNWAQSSNAVDKLSLNTRNNGSLAAYVESVETMISQAQQRAKDAWIQDYLHKDTISQLEQQHFDRNTSSNVKSFLAKAVKNAENFGRNMELARQHKLEGQALSFAEQVSRDIQIRYDNAIKKQTGKDADLIQKLASSIEVEIKKHAYNVDTMERSLGTSRMHDIATSSSWLLSHAHRMTWKEAKNAGAALGDAKYVAQKQSKSVKDTMTEIEEFVKNTQGKEAFDRLLQITVDQHNLFVTREGNAFSKELTSQPWRSFLQFARNTLPGKLFKIGDIDNALRFPATQMINLQAQDPILKAKLKKMGEEDNYHIRIGKDIYSLDLTRPEGSRMYLNKELANAKIVSGRYGFYHSQIEALSGKTKTSISDNWLFRKLDIFQDREEYSGNLISNKMSVFFGRNGRAERFFNQLEMSPDYEAQYQRAVAELHRFSNDPDANFLTALSDETKDFVLDYMETQKKISEIFKHNTYKMNTGTIDALLQSNKLNERSRYLLELLQEDDTTKILDSFLDPKGEGNLGIKPLLSGTTVNFVNKDLQTLISGVRNNPEITRNKISLVTNEMRLSYGTDLINLFRSPMSNTTYTFEDVLKREVAKEALLRQGLEDGPIDKVDLNYDRINELLESVTLTDINRKEVTKLAQFGIWQNYTNINRKVRTDDIMYVDYFEKMMRTDKILRGNSKVARKFQDTYCTVMQDEISWLEGNISSEAPGVESLEDYIVINRSASPLDIVQGLNRAIFEQDTSKIKADIMNIVRGLSANREDMSGANLYTFIPFFTMKRLSDELNRVGLGFSSESTKSTADLAMSFMTKRVLPIAVGATYLDFADDITKETTGTGLWEGFTAGVANVDLAARKVISGLGADDWLKQAKSVNPIWQYWGDKDDYQGYEERLDYYQKGYTPVRKAAWSNVGHAA